MKIVIIGTAHPYRGGLAAFNERLAKEFINQGHIVEIYTFTLQYPNFLFPGKTQYSTEPAPENLAIHRKVNSCNPLNWLKVGKELSNARPDAVIIPYWTSYMAPCFGTVARQIGKNHHTKIVGLVHNMFPHEPNIIDKFFPKYFVKNVDGFITLSKSVLEDVAKIDKKSKPKVFSPHPIYDHFGELLPQNEAFSLLNLDKNYKYVLFFGFIRAYKGLDLLLEAFADQRFRDNNIKLLVAGEFYTDSAPYLQKIKDLKIEDSVELHTNFIPESQVNRYFSAADIVAQPYKTATQSGVTQICYHFEKPMLITNVGGLAEIVPNGKIGYVVEPNPQSIADALCDYFVNDRKKTFEMNIREEKKRFSWTFFYDKIEELLQKI